jgi:endonuclease/exonuclease/phosphatase family metal-dependent hydrolase
VIGSLQAAAFGDVLEAAPGPLYTSPKSKQRLDWIFVRGLQSHDAGIHPLEISGHFPVTSKISMARNVELKTCSSLAREIYREEGDIHEG